MRQKAIGSLLAAAMVAGCGGPEPESSFVPETRQSALRTTDTVTLTSLTALNTRRTSLINKVWNQSTINTTAGADSTTSLSLSDPTLIGSVPNLLQARRFRFNMSRAAGAPAVVGEADVYQPITANGRLVVLNPGHKSGPGMDNCFFGGGGMDQVVRDLVQEGFMVLATYMPRQSPNNCVGNATAVGGPHDSLFGTDKPANGNGLRHFLDPVRRGLNQLIFVEQRSFTDISMAGLSGGGLTTVLYAALDTRIKTSIDVAGTKPFTLMMDPSAVELDYTDERTGQTATNDFYSTATGTGFLDLYLMDSVGAGRRHVQVVIRHDDCCSGEATAPPPTSTWTDRVRAYEADVRNQIFLIDSGSGSFRVEIDDTVSFHGVSDTARVTSLLAEIDGANRIVGPADDSNVFGRAYGGILHHRGASWSNLGFAMVGAPAALANAVSPNTFDVFYRDNANYFRHAYWIGSWYSEGLFGAVLGTDPVATSWGQGRIDLAALGLDSKPYHWFYDNGSWGAASGAGPISNTIGAGPVALTSWGPGHLDMLFRDSGRNLTHVSSAGGPPYATQAVPAGPVVKGYPTLVSSSAGGGTLWGFVASADGRLWQAYKQGNGSWSWYDVSGNTQTTSHKIFGSPVARMESGLPVIYVRTDVNTLGRFYWSGGAFHLALFQSLGGMADPPAVANGSRVYAQGNNAVFSVDGAGGGWTALGGPIAR